jgi:hypothetical protein
MSQDGGGASSGALLKGTEVSFDVGDIPPAAFKVYLGEIIY